MSTSRPRRPSPRTLRVARRRRRRLRFTVGAAVATAVAVSMALSVGTEDTARNSGGTGLPTASTAGRASAGTAGPETTGEVNAMGMPVVSTPGAAAGRAAVAGVEVTGADWDLGRVPLDVAVRPSWTLRNTGTTSVSLGEPRAEVRKGCCPGPLALGATSLAPGETTTLVFELSMHRGMDGPHDLGVHVPVTTEGAAGHLTLGVVGDFR